MKSIPFDRSPAYVTLGEALSLGARYWRATWDRWVLAVVAVGLASGLVAWLFPAPAIDQQTLTRTLMPGASGALDPSELPTLLAGPLALGIVGLVADWFLVANAVAGLRRREVTGAWVLASGLRTLLAIFVASMALSSAALLLALLGPAGLIVVLLALPVLLYVAVRMQFWMLGVFDGLGIVGSVRESWNLTRGAVLRVIGWWAALLGLSLLLSIVDGALAVILGSLPAAAAATGAVLSTSFQAFSTVVIAILYESQRQRRRAAPVASPPGAGPYDPPAPYDPSGREPPPPPAPPHDPWNG
jgi:hypothetical protein